MYQAIVDTVSTRYERGGVRLLADGERVSNTYI